MASPIFVTTVTMIGFAGLPLLIRPTLKFANPVAFALHAWLTLSMTPVIVGMTNNSSSLGRLTQAGGSLLMIVIWAPLITRLWLATRPSKERLS